MKGLIKKVVLLYCVLEFWGRKKESKRFIKQNWTPISIGSSRRGQAACMTEHQRVRRGIGPPESIRNSPGTGKQQLLMIAARATFSPRVHARAHGAWQRARLRSFTVRIYSGFTMLFPPILYPRKALDFGLL